MRWIEESVKNDGEGVRVKNKGERVEGLNEEQGSGKTISGIRVKNAKGKIKKEKG